MADFDKIKDTSRNEFKVLEEFKKLGVDGFPICMAKTQKSLVPAHQVIFED